MSDAFVGLLLILKNQLLLEVMFTTLKKLVGYEKMKTFSTAPGWLW
jgi:hypothetical protein